MTIAGSRHFAGMEHVDHWTGRMIAPDVDEGVGSRASFVSQTFTASHSGTARLRISAQGLYRAFLNGERVGRDCLTPGWTCYDDRIAWQEYDVTDLLVQGENRIEIWLGDGWYRSPLMWREYAIPNCWGDKIAAIAEIATDNGILCATDEAWQSGLLPITKSGIYYGEDHDARLAKDVTGGVVVLPREGYRLVPQEADPVKELPAFDPVDSWPEGNETVYDFAQNAAGYARIRVAGEAGAKVVITFSEVLGPDKTFDNRNFRKARAALTYTLSGKGEEVWEPTFTFMGFRYAKVRIEGQAKLLSISSVPISSVPQLRGNFTCGIEAVNRLVQNTIWSQRANFIEIPTDCPQRDERLGWTGDAQVFAGTACWLADSERFLAKYMRDVIHEQREDGGVPHFAPDPTRRPGSTFTGDWAGSTGWGDVVTVLPWQLYLHYGRTEILRDCFPAMLKWLDYLWGISDGPIIHPHSSWGQKGFTFGDWLQPVGDNRKPRPTIGDDCAATLYHYISTHLTARIARILGETAEAERCETRAAEIRDAFAHEYISASGRLAHNDQTSYALAFLYDLIPEAHRDAAAGYFRRVIVDAKYKIGTGFIGTPALLPALSKLGMADLAEKVFLNRKVPGWLYQVDRGATTIWERWDAIGEDGTIYDPMMNSYNHYAYGAVCQWLFEDVAGVQPLPEAPGFDRVRLQPTILPELGRVEMWHDCRHGRITSAWVLEGTRVAWRIELPAGCEGWIPAGMLPELSLNGSAATVPAEGLTLPAGRHEIGFDHVA